MISLFPVFSSNKSFKISYQLKFGLYLVYLSCFFHQLHASLVPSIFHGLLKKAFVYKLKIVFLKNRHGYRRTGPPPLKFNTLSVHVNQAFILHFILPSL